MNESRPDEDEDYEAQPSPPWAETERRRGKTGLTVALLGFLLPTGYYTPANIYYFRVNDLGWTEGGGLIVLIECLVIVLVSELIALRLGIQAWRVATGKVTVGISIIVLGAFIWFSTVLVMAQVQVQH